LAAFFADDDLGGHGDSADPAVLPNYLSAFDAIEASPNERLYVSEWDGVVAGTFQTALLRTLTGQGASALLVQAVHVRKDLRSNGIGHEMMRFCIATAKEAGAGKVKLMSNRLRADAHRFYEGLGFRQSHLGYTLLLE
jgi:GNAT superfamily N-acetyltransferase